VLLSILVPVYNESATIVQILERVFAQDWPVEIELIVVDDASRDRTSNILSDLQLRWENLRVLRHLSNRGKGAAIRTALEAARGQIVAIQDADLEYDPADLVKLLGPILAGEADVVYGSRFLNECLSPTMHRWANKILTAASNLFTGLHLTDMETCYKVIRRKCLDNMTLRSNRFGIEPELTAKLARSGGRIVEMPISYRYRSHAEGKKIGWRDGLKALAAIAYFSQFD